MRYAIVKMGRAVSLDDRLVDEYARYGELRECVFTIGVRSRFGHWPTPEEVSDEELSKLCNKLLLDELKAFALLPKAAAAVDRELKKIREGSMAEQEKIKRCYNCANCDNNGFRDICKSCDPKTNDKWEPVQSEPEIPEAYVSFAKDLAEYTCRFGDNTLLQFIRKCDPGVPTKDLITQKVSLYLSLVQSAEDVRYLKDAINGIMEPRPGVNTGVLAEELPWYGDNPLPGPKPREKLGRELINRLDEMFPE